MRHMPIAAIVAASAMTFTHLALAADLPIKAPAAPVAASYSWTGFYVGANGGYAWHDSTVIFTGNDFLSNIQTCGGNLGGTCPPPVSFNIRGGLGGLQAGYNWQFNPSWLLGIETDFDWADINGTGSNNFRIGGVPTNSASFVVNQKIESFGTVRARLGYLPTDRTLLYATGGFAYGHVKENVALNSTPNGGGSSDGTHGFICVANTSCFLGNSSRTATGWTAGAGVEYAFWNNFTLRLEYLFVSLGGGDIVNVVAQNVPGGNVPSSFSASFNRTDFNVVRGGVNYRF